MAIEITSLSDIDQQAFATARQLIVQMAQEAHPDLDVRRGAFHDLVLYIASEYAAANSTNIDRLRRSSSLEAVEEDPTLADDDVLDRLASNYGVTRSEGSRATGSVIVILDALMSVVVPADAVFTDDSGREFVTPTAFAARTSPGEVVADTDRLVAAVGDGTWYFVITVEAADVGTTGNIARGSNLTSASTLSSHFVRAYAGNTFSGGTDAETNEQLAARIRVSWTCRSLASRSGVENLLRSVSGFENLAAVSVIGYGDAEQRRDHSILPLAIPGRVDVWMKSSASGIYSTILVTKTATYQGPGGVGTLWRFTLTRDDVPGFYEIEKIHTAAGIDDDDIAGYAITDELPGYDISAGATDGLTFIPDIQSAVEAAFSRYQTAQIEFNDVDTPTTGLTAGVSTKSYAVLVRAMPGIDVLQDAVCNRDSRSLAGDCLVRAAVPCFVSATLNVGLPTGTTLSDAQKAAIKQDLVNTVNATGFTGSLSVATILSSLADVLPAGVVATSLSLSGRLRRPDGTELALGPSSAALTVPSDPANLVTARTAGFFAEVGDVTLTTSVL